MNLDFAINLCLPLVQRLLLHFDFITSRDPIFIPEKATLKSGGRNTNRDDLSVRSKQALGGIEGRETSCAASALDVDNLFNDESLVDLVASVVVGQGGGISTSISQDSTIRADYSDVDIVLSGESTSKRVGDSVKIVGSVIAEPVAVGRDVCGSVGKVKTGLIGDLEDYLADDRAAIGFGAGLRRAMLRRAMRLRRRTSVMDVLANERHMHATAVRSVDSVSSELKASAIIVIMVPRADPRSTLRTEASVDQSSHDREVVSVHCS